MKTNYSSAFLCFSLVGFCSWAQLDQTTVPTAGGAGTIPLSPAEVAVLEAASNAVQAATIIWLPDQAAPTSQWSPAGTVGVPPQDASSNGQNTVRFVYQTSPAVVAATMSAALGAVQTGNSPQPLDSLGACIRPGSGLTAWWQAEGNAYDTLGTFHGQAPNGVLYVSGQVGQAFSLNGTSQSIQIPYSSALATPGFSVEAWVNPAHQLSAQAFLFGQAYGRQLVVSPGSGGLNVSFFVTDANGVFHGVASSRVIPIGQWTHLAGTWDGASLKLYLDGAQDRSASLQLSAIGNSGCPFSIGGMVNSCGYSGQYFPGLIDEVSLYNRALFPGEINAIYLAGSAGKCTTPPVCAACPASAVSSWPAEGDASDVLGSNPGTLQNGASCTAGIVGQAFSFDGISRAVEIPSAPGLVPAAFSVEAWIKPASPVGHPPGQAFIFGQSYGRQLILRPAGQGFSVAFLISSAPWPFYEVDSSGSISLDQWSHLVGTWDGSCLRLFINGALDQQAPVNLVPWDSGCAFHIGGIYDLSGGCAYVGQFFNGLIDETTYYNQALSAGEVQSLYNAGGAGKCAAPPAISSGPQSQQVTAGNDALFQVVATGRNLSYQWSLNGNMIADATDATLYLPNVGAGNVGTYTVTVSSDAGSVTSDGAVLTVVPAVPVPVPAGVVAWWPGEDIFSQGNSTAEDVIGNNPGEARSYLGAGAAEGKVGYAFEFNGSSADLLIPAKDPNEGGLNSSSWEGFTIEGWINPADVSTAQPIMEQWDSASGKRITLSLASCAPGSLELTYVDSGTHQLCSGPGVLRANTFQHVALAYENHLGTIFLKLYVNGQLVAANGDQLQMALGANDFYFGSSPSGNFRTQWDTPLCYGGLMDELTIYSRALDTSDILGIYNAGSAGKIPPCRQVPGGCVSWWQGEVDGSDVYALNPAALEGGISFTPGKIGQAFTLSGASSARVPASDSLNVGAGAGFTLEAWVKPDSTAIAQPILEWNSGSATAVALWISASGTLCADIPDEALMDNPIISGTPLTPGVFQHVALTYDSSDSMGRLYFNGTEVTEASCSFLLPIFTTTDLYFGFSPADDALGTGTQFAGQIDEVGLYNRALSATEIRRLYTAAGGGKCGIPPTILTQPTSQVANVGNNVAFQVSAAGSSLTYQWFFNNGGGAQPITGATGPVLDLMDLQAAQAGTYSVRIANALDAVVSAEVALTVNSVGNGTPPVIVTQPASQTSVCQGGGFGLTVSATGFGSLRYQWCKNGFNINGATSSSFTIAQAGPADAGTYTVIVYDSRGHVASSDAAVTLHPRPTATVIGDATVPSGAPAVVEAVLTGSKPWTLTWHVDAEVGGGSDLVETGVTDNPHLLLAVPTSTTTYTVTSLLDASGCQATAADLTGHATLTVSGASEEPPTNVGMIHLAGTHTGFTFTGDCTYYVDGHNPDGSDGPVHLYGTTTIEGGTVVRFSSSSDAKIIIHDPQIICDTGPYRPAIFAYANDWDYGYNEVWEDTEATHFGQGISLACPPGSTVVLRNLRFFNLDCGLSIEGGGAGSGTSSYKIYDSQFVDCDTALSLTEPNGCAVKVLNALFSDDTSVLAVTSAVQASHVDFQQVTADNCVSFVAGLASAPSAVWTGLNCLLVNIQQNPASIPASILTATYCRVIGGNPFTTGGDGLHYLADDTYRGMGSPSIDSALLNELPQKTTHPPLDFPFPLQPDGQFYFQTSGSLTLSPQVPRCLNNNSLPDLGYAYDPLDYTLSTFWLHEGGQITVLPGTAIGFRFDWYVGFLVDQGTAFISQGTPNKPITYAPVSLVQEGPFMPQSNFPGLMLPFIPNYWPFPDFNPDCAPPPSLDFRFSNFYLNSGLSHHFWSGMGAIEMFEECWSLSHVCLAASVSSAMSLQIRDCNLHSGWFNLGELDGRVAAPVCYGGTVIPSSVSLMNNLFDRVNCNFDPDTGPTYWDGPYADATVDLSLTATNNLFRGGWLFLEPVSGDTPQWAFANNLLDTVTVAQDVTQPFCYDHNGYYPQGTTYKLNGPGGAGDVSLDQAPPYEPGPLGSFYLPDTTPLHGAGSCSPAEVGLFHYTSRTDQVKEGASQNVNIGLHYVAVNATDPDKGSPQDWDGDGIPDYVENWHGDGDYLSHTDTETDWQSPETDQVTPDLYNTIYDDIDLSGDGLVGRIKKALGMAALDTSNPLAVSQVPSGSDPDIVAFEVPIHYTTLASLGELELLIDGQPATFHQFTPANDGNCLLAWNTPFDWPGQHCLQAELRLGLQITKGDDPDPTVGSASGPLTPFYSANVLKFHPFYTEYHGDKATLYAELPEAEADYTIELHDPSDPDGLPIETIEGHTLNGEIRKDWIYTMSSVEAVFDVTLTASGRNGISRHRIRDNQMIPGAGGDFTIAYAWDNDEQAQGSMHDAIQYSVVDNLLSPYRDGGGGSADYYDSTFNQFSYAPLGQSGIAGYIPDQTKVQGLIDSLSDYFTRNFYFDGHGGTDNLGDGPNRGLVRIDVDSVANALGNSYQDYQLVRGHPYRFVFLNACDTADNNRWCHAFGVWSSILTADDITDWPDGAQAFVGFHGEVRGASSDEEWRQLSQTYTVFFGAWMQGYTLDQCVKFASSNHPGAPFGNYTLEFPLSTPYQNPLKRNYWYRPWLQVFGYHWITRGGYALPP